MAEWLYDNAMNIVPNFFALTIMVILCINNRAKKTFRLPDQKLFTVMLCLNASLLLMDMILGAMQGIPGKSIYIVLSVFTSIYIVAVILLFISWLFYILYFIKRDAILIRKIALYVTIPLTIAVLVVISCVYKGCIFYIDEHNIYHRGTFFMLITILSYIYVLCTYIYIILNRKQIKQKEYNILLLILLPVLIAGVVTANISRINLVWIGVSISLLLAYINIQTRLLSLDYLTGLYNRREFDNLFKSRISPNNKKKTGAIMLDIEDFKSINDMYGHDMGDSALISTADILRKSFGKDSFIARYGGDEFIILIENGELEKIKELVDRLKKNIEHFNEHSKKVYSLNLSIGYDIYSHDISPAEFFKSIDKKMYLDKQRRKNQEKGH